MSDRRLLREPVFGYVCQSLEQDAYFIGVTNAINELLGYPEENLQD